MSQRISRPLRRPIAIALAVAVCVLMARPVAAQEDPSTTTSTSSTTTTSTTVPVPTVPTTPTSQPDDTTTTSTTINEEDPVGHVDAPPEEPPISDITVPPAPGEAVDGDAASRLIRREIDVARADALESEQEVAEAAQTVDELSDRLAGLQRELARLGVAQELAVQRLELAQETFEQRVANAVVRGNAAELETIVASKDANEFGARRVMLQSVAEADSDAVREYQLAKEVVDEGVLEAIEDVGRTRRELRAARKHFEQVLSLNAERRFQLAVFAAGSEIVIRGFVFPVGEPYSFIDSWGFPRMTGTEYEHGHQGTDIMADFGTPLYAVERGVVIRVGVDVLGGQKLWVKGQSGTYYYYAHLQAFVEGVGEGTPVEAGDVVGFVGDTGNAKGGAPHLHFQVHPGGGPPVNPYGLLKVVSDLSRRA